MTSWIFIVKTFIPAIALCLLWALSVTVFAAASSSGKVVRVGWFSSPFYYLDSFGRRSGYAYEYQQQIAVYTGWSYEYVHGSWPELFEKLKTGEIDLLSDVSYTPERSASMLFSTAPMGSESYYLFATAENTEKMRKNIAELNGKTIGVNLGSYQEDLLRAWAADNALSPNIVGVTTDEAESFQLLDAGQLDAFVTIDSYGDKRSYLPVCKIGQSDFFFAVSKARPDLLQELNFAMGKIYDKNCHYTDRLYDKYIKRRGTNVFLAGDDIEWLKQHGVIRVGYLDNYLPFCAADQETGELTGALKHYLERATSSLSNTRIDFAASPYPTLEAALAALLAGEIDCVFPVNFNTHDGDSRGMMQTIPLAQTEMYAIVRKTDHWGTLTESKLRAAVPKDNPNYETFRKDNFPGWQLVPCDGMEACFAAVADSQADCVLVSNYRLPKTDELRRLYKLSDFATGATMELAFAVRKTDSALYSILDKTATLVPEAVMASALVAYSYPDDSFSLMKFLQEHLVLVIAVLLGGAALSVLLLNRRAKRTKRELEERLELKNRLLEQERQRRQADAMIASMAAEAMEKSRALSDALSQAKAASVAKTAFLSSMSHEIRTPMNAIIGLNSLALKESGLSVRIREYLEKIDVSAKHLLGLINDILDMSRIESGRLSIRQEEFSLSEMLSQVNTIIQGQCQEKGLAYDFRIEGQVPDRYLGDDVKLKQVIINILGNAVKFTTAPGTISFMVEAVTQSEDNAILRFGMKDTGIGMDKDFLPKIFNAFSQENAQRVNKYGSTGLGMAISKNIVELMNGKIEVESEKGVGSAFTVTLPLKIVHAEAAETASETNPSPTEAHRADLTGKKILLAEDMPVNAEIMKELLRMRDMEVEHAENGQIAVDMFARSGIGFYDAILMDVQMPVLDGLRATEAIRSMERPDAKDIPIIAMTANAFDEDVQRSLQAGMTAHLSKPVELERLFATLETLIRED